MNRAENPAGMDDEDIEWELDKMDGKNPLQEPQPAQPLNPTYRPADPAMVARIYRQMGRPYDASLIPEKERYYLNGWDNGEDDDIDDQRRKLRPLPLQDEARSPGEPFDPWKNVWKLDWGPEGSPADRPRPRTGYQPGQFGSNGFGGGLAPNGKGYGASGGAAGGVQEMSYNAAEVGGGGDGGGTKTAKFPWVNGTGVVAGLTTPQAISASGFAKEVEKAALENGDSPELARQKGIDAGWKYIGYLTGVVGASQLAEKLGGKKWGSGAKGAVGAVGAAGGEFAAKPIIKQHVLRKNAADYERDEKPLFPMNTPPGPG